MLTLDFKIVSRDYKASPLQLHMIFVTDTILSNKFTAKTVPFVNV
jgi:hypothetical protein